MSEISSAWSVFFIILGTAMVSALAASIWVVFSHRKPRRRQRRHRLNPTLAQVGGLPPVRDEEKSSEPPTPTSPP
ncbi:MAG: hypothetical protein ABSF51_03070 [Verrucomicrobiota bacterium]|jgi:hypothetical protein